MCPKQACFREYRPSGCHTLYANGSLLILEFSTVLLVLDRNSHKLDLIQIHPNVDIFAVLLVLDQ